MGLEGTIRHKLNVTVKNRDTSSYRRGITTNSVFDLGYQNGSWELGVVTLPSRLTSPDGGG